MVAQPVVACVSFHLQRTSSLSTCIIDRLGGAMASCSKCNRRAAWRFEEQLLSCQPDATPWWPPFLRASSSVGTAAVNCCKRSRHTGSGARLECLRHTTRDEAQLQARQPAASSQGAGPKRQRLEVRAHAAALRGLSKSSKPRLRQSGGTSGG